LAAVLAAPTGLVTAFLAPDPAVFADLFAVVVAGTFSSLMGCHPAHAGAVLVVRMTLFDVLICDLSNFGASRKPFARFVFVRALHAEGPARHRLRTNWGQNSLAYKGNQQRCPADRASRASVCGVQDDLGNSVDVASRPRRIVSIVPSLTESIALTDASLLVGATDWCTHPHDLEVTRVRGTKNPDVELIQQLHPDIVVANAEENRAVDLQRIRELGIPVWVTAPTTVKTAMASLAAMFEVLHLGRPDWLTVAEREWGGPKPPARRHAVVPIWRRPWMALGRDTFAGDVLAHLGVGNVLEDHDERYPRIDLGRLPAHDLVVLPDEPYAFAEDDGPEAFSGVQHACVSGRHLTWYGPSLVEARQLLTAQLAAARWSR
jgi:hypothetical protein